MTATVETTAQSPSATKTRRSVDLLAIALAAVIFSSLSIWAAMASPGFLEADSCTHYQYARFALGETHFLVNVWGRPFVTALYAIPATLAGRIGVRLTSLACALIIATAAYRIARHQGYRRPALAFIFVLAQPLLFLHSFSELTELPFAMLLALAFWCYCKREWFAMAAVTALLPTARPEGFGFLILAAIALMAHRRWWWIAVLPVPLIVWTYAGWVIYGRPTYAEPAWLSEKLRWVMWLKHQWPYAQESTYAAGPVWHFAWLLPAVVGPMMLPFVVMGLLPLPGTPGRGLGRGVINTGRSTRDGFEMDSSKGVLSSTDSESSRIAMHVHRTPPPSPLPASGEGEQERHRARCQLLIVAIPLMILAGHSLLYALGRMASSGEVRYMLVVAPFWALLAARGWEWTFARFNWRHPYVWAGAAALVPVAMNAYYQVVPIELTHDSYRARAVARWYRDSGISIEYPRLMCSNPEVAYYMDVSHTDDGWIRPWDKQTAAKAPAGTLMVWEPTYALNNSDTNRVITLDEVGAAGWIERPDLVPPMLPTEPTREWRIFLSPRSIFGRDSERWETSTH